MSAKKPLGKLSPEKIRLMEAPSIPADIIARFNNLSDLTGTISDVCDSLGLSCLIPAMELKPTTTRRIVGPALTVRNIPRSAQIYKAVVDKSNLMGETEAHNIAKPGDVLVIEGLAGVSAMGGLSASMGKRQGQIGAIIDGSVRDPDAYEKLDWPVWCRGYTPITGKWRGETVEVNGTVRICGIQCSPGDLVCADRAGVAIVPRQMIEDVLEICEVYDKADGVRQADIDSGMPMHEIMAKKYK